MEPMSVPSAGSGATPSIVSNNPIPSRIGAGETFEKPRSCVVCAQRKVRCDKRHPCSRCQRAGIRCVLPSTDHRPRSGRHFIPSSGSDAGALSNLSAPVGLTVNNIVGRLRQLERLVKDLSDELEEARTAPSAAASNPESISSEASSTHAVVVSRAGRIVLDDSNHVRYMSNGFWSRIDYELDSLKEDIGDYGSDGTEEAFGGDQSQLGSSLSAMEANPTPSDRYAFLLSHHWSSSSQDTLAMLPMASQVPFLLEVFSERVHCLVGLPHIPSLKKRLQQRQSGRKDVLSPGEEALMFSVYYAAICSLDEEEVTDSFNVSKDELVVKYRTGLECALAKADFLNNPSDLLMQSLIIFLVLARQFDTPKFVWMMTGLAIRMGHYLGTHQDGSGSKYISPFQAEMQRRTWWALCALDTWVTEDHGTELAIPHGSYTTRAPSNINDADIWPEMEHLPQGRQGLTDVTFHRLCCETTRTIQEMMATGAAKSVDDHNQRLNDLKQLFEREYFSLADHSQRYSPLAAAGTLRIVLARLSLLAYPPVFSSPSESLSMELRSKLLVAALEVIEHKHALNSDASCRSWKWIYQAQQHWHAVIYLLIEICRRPWSPTAERAWVALQSPWLVPVRTSVEKNVNFWAPIRKLMARARKHRESELIRLQAQPSSAAQIEREDQQQVPTPSSSITFPTYFAPEIFHSRWRQLIHPAPVTTTNAFSGTVSNGQETYNLDGSFTSSTNVNTMHENVPLLHDNQSYFTETPNDRTASLASEPRMTTPMDLTDSTNLAAFLGGDAEMGSLDGVNTNDALDVDWNSFFESFQRVS